MRAQFLIPQHDGADQAYFVGNSLGLQPRGARRHVEEVLDKWAAEAVEGHFTGQAQWMPYHQLVRESLARLVGAKPVEVVAMNTLTVNLHLMMVSFYRPTRERPAILIEAGAFPSDRHAVASQIGFHGFDPATDLIELEADEADGTISMAAIERAIAEHGPRLALVLWPGVQYRTGQAFDLAGDRAPRACAGRRLRLRPRARRRQPRARAARQRRRFRGLVPLQVPQQRPGRGRRLLRARAPRQQRSPALRRLVGTRSRHALPHGPAVRADARAPTAGS